MEETAIEKIEPTQQGGEPVLKSEPIIHKKATDEKATLSHLIDYDVQRRFDLDEKDMKIVEYLLRNFIDGHEMSKASVVLSKVETDIYKVIPSSKRLIKLKHSGVIEVLSETEDDTDIYLLFSSNIRIANGFLKLLFK